MADTPDGDLDVLNRSTSDSSRLLALKRLAGSGRPDLAQILQPIAQKDRSFTVRYLAQRLLKALGGAPAGFGDPDPAPRASLPQRVRAAAPKPPPAPTEPALAIPAPAPLALEDQPTSPQGIPVVKKDEALERAALAVLRPCIAQMIELCETPDAELGAECALALGRLRVAEAFDRVAARVRSGAPDERLVKALGEIGDPRAAALLARLWGDARWAKLRPAIGVAACRIRSATAEELVREWLGGEDLAAQGAIIRQLGHAGDGRFADALLAKLGASEEWIEVLAIQSLAPLAGRDARVAQALLERIPREANPRTASCIISALAEAKDPALVGALERLMRQKDRRVRANAVEAVWRLPVAVDGKVRMLRPLALDEDNRVRANAARLLVQLGDDAGVEALKGMLASKDRLCRMSACHALGVCRPPGTAALLARALRDPELEVRLNATRALRDVDEPQVAQLSMSLLADKNLYIRMHALETLGNLGVKNASSTVRRLLREEINPQVLAAALRAAARTSPPDAVAREVAPFVTHSAAAVRLAAVEALEPTLGDETLSMLMPALKDPDRKVRSAAVRALMRAGQVKVVSKLYETLLGEDRKEQSAVAHALGELADVVFDLRGAAHAERLVEALRRMPAHAT